MSSDNPIYLTKKHQVSILCVAPKSNYNLIPNLDLWPAERDAYNFKSTNPVITHAPCQQWSRLKHMAIQDSRQKDLAYFCWEVVNKNGGIFEHPAHSSFFKAVNADKKKIICVDQHWWGFRLKKPTWLYFHNCKPAAHPLNFNCYQDYWRGGQRSWISIMPVEMCNWMIDAVRPLLVYHNSHHAPLL